MTWYDDLGGPQDPSAPGPPVPPSTPGTPQQGPPSVPPQMPGGQPPIGPPPGVQGDLPTTGGGNNNQLLLIIAGMAVVAVITIAGAIGALFLFSGPEELSMSDYAGKMCDEAVKPTTKELRKLRASRRYQKRVVNEDVESEAEAEEALELVAENLELQEQLNAAIESFNGGHIVSGRDGEKLQTKLDGYVEDVKRDLDKAREVLSDADPADEEDVVDDIDEVSRQFEMSAIYKTDRDPGYDLYVEMEDADRDCDIFYAAYFDE